MSHRQNIIRIKAVHNGLMHLRNRVVYVGGATMTLYVDRMAEEIRPTDDVDVVIEILTLNEYKEIEEQLRKIGFVHDKESGIICHYRIQGVTVDIMPTEETVLGFRNKWYPEGFTHAIDFPLDDRYTVKIFTLPYFMASKLDAFLDDPKLDGLGNKHFEDIVSLLEYRGSVWDDLNNSTGKVHEYLKAKFAALLANPFFLNWLEAHTAYGAPPATYYILEKLKEFSKR